jgi:hypothetical protein
LLVALSTAERRLLGLDATDLEPVGGHWLLPEARDAFLTLAQDARAAGFDLRIASAHRDFERQLVIWNGKLSGLRPVLDDTDAPVDIAALAPRERIECVLRFSALPGASRHHWGSDLDVFDGAAVPDDYRLRLDNAEVADDGVFGPLHCWLDERIADGKSHGFFRPYDRDRGGTAPERWHLSYAPAAQAFLGRLSCDLLRRAWDEVAAGELALRDCLDDCLEELFERFVARVADPT